MATAMVMVTGIPASTVFPVLFGPDVFPVPHNACVALMK